MSPTRLTARRTARHLGRPGAVAALALSGLLLTGACGTVHAGADAGSAEPAVAASAPVPAASTASSPAVPAAPTSPAPAARVSRVRTPVTLPVTAVSTNGVITGTVSSGMLGCLVVRTDAGQVFGIAGSPTARLRQLLPAASLATGPTGVVHTPGIVERAPGISGVRISAAGTLRPAPSFCGSSYTFTIATMRVESLPLR